MNTVEERIPPQSPLIHPPAADSRGEEKLPTRQTIQAYWDQHNPDAEDMIEAIGRDSWDADDLQKELYSRFPYTELTVTPQTGGTQLYIFSRCGKECMDWWFSGVMTIRAAGITEAYRKALCRIATHEELEKVKTNMSEV